MPIPSRPKYIRVDPQTLTRDPPAPKKTREIDDLEELRRRLPPDVRAMLLTDEEWMGIVELCRDLSRAAHAKAPVGPNGEKDPNMTKHVTRHVKDAIHEFFARAGMDLHDYAMRPFGLPVAEDQRMASEALNRLAKTYRGVMRSLLQRVKAIGKERPKACMPPMRAEPPSSRVSRASEQCDLGRAERLARQQPQAPSPSDWMPRVSLLAAPSPKKDNVNSSDKPPHVGERAQSRSALQGVLAKAPARGVLSSTTSRGAAGQAAKHIHADKSGYVPSEWVQRTVARILQPAPAQPPLDGQTAHNTDASATPADGPERSRRRRRVSCETVTDEEADPWRGSMCAPGRKLVVMNP